VALAATAAGGAFAVGYMGAALVDAGLELRRQKARGRALDIQIGINKGILIAKEAKAKAAAAAALVQRMLAKCARISVALEISNPQWVVRGRGKCDVLYQVCFELSKKELDQVFGYVAPEDLTPDRCIRCQRECLRNGRWPFIRCPMLPQAIVAVLRYLRLL
jgi:hypothetical protein